MLDSEGAEELREDEEDNEGGGPRPERRTTSFACLGSICHP